MWWDGKSRKPECRTRTDGSSVTHREERLKARPEDRNKGYARKMFTVGREHNRI